MRIGFIGLGIMGESMCSNIIKKSGKEVIVFDLNHDKVNQLVGEGALVASSIKEVGEKADVIITMVPKSEHVVSVYNDLLLVIKSGQILIDMSTIDPSVSVELSKKVADRGAIMLDAPVVKSKPAAISGTLGIYVGGDHATYNKVNDILLMMGSNTIHIGENGKGLIMKICHNMLVGEIQNGVNEMITLATSQGISVDNFAKAISFGGGQNFYLDGKAPAIRDNNYKTAFSVENMNKDVNIAASLVNELGLNLPGVKLVQEVYKKAMESDLGKEDFSATFKIVSK
jgi:3-hydroxyisobutyrate dehydrogenase